MKLWIFTVRKEKFRDILGVGPHPSNAVRTVIIKAARYSVRESILSCAGEKFDGLKQLDISFFYEFTKEKYKVIYINNGIQYTYEKLKDINEQE